MRQEIGTDMATLKSRRGLERHRSNPFVQEAAINTKQGVKRLTNSHGDRMMLVSESTGEVMGQGAGFWQAQEVDRTQFVKLYVNGVKAFKDLTGAGTKVFELLYIEVQKGIGKDVVHLSFSDLDQQATPMSKATFMKGMKELLTKDFIAETFTQGKYFLNPDYMWNGDRLAFVKEYRRAAEKPKAKLVDDKTGDLFEALTAE
jgi:hypothetical protein